MFELTEITAALRAGEVGIWDWSVSGEPSRVCPYAARLLGLPDAPLSGDLRVEDFIAHIHPDDRRSVRRAVGDALVRGGPFVVGCRTIPQDGPSRRLVLQGTVELDRTGMIKRARGIVVDRSRGAEHQSAETGLEHLARIALEAWSSMEDLTDEDRRDIEPAIRTLLFLIARRLSSAAFSEPTILGSLRSSLHS